MKTCVIVFFPQLKHNSITVWRLTHVFSDDGEGLQVGFPDILCQRARVVLKVSEQMCGPALCPLDLVPVVLGVGIQYGAACSHQVLEKTQIAKLRLKKEFIYSNKSSNG